MKAMDFPASCAPAGCLTWRGASGASQQASMHETPLAAVVQMAISLAVPKTRKYKGLPLPLP